MKKLTIRLLYYLARKLGYGLILYESKHFYHTEINARMPKEIYIDFA